MELRTYSRKQAGVIYSAMKRGDIECPKEVISDMYDMAGSVEVCNTGNLGDVENFAAGIRNAVDSIFAGDYEGASKTLARLAA